MAAMTIHWRPNENSLARESFNNIVRKKRTNVPAVLMRTATMSRLAMRGQDIVRDSDAGLGARPRRASDDLSHSRSVQFDNERGDGFGSIRLGTPTTEQRQGRGAYFNSSLDRSCSMPVFRKTPAARYGYMPPEVGKLERGGSKASSGHAEAPPRGAPQSSRLSPELARKVEELFGKMDYDNSGDISREDAKHFFKSFATVSVNAMFNEVDEDSNNNITSEEFRHFWEQVKGSGYPEEDLLFELDELLDGNVWVDYADSRDVGNGHEKLGSKY